MATELSSGFCYDIQSRHHVDAKVPVDKLITHRYSLDQAVEAFQTFDGATTGKYVFEEEVQSHFFSSPLRHPPPCLLGSFSN